jgi:hypothetical protein
MRSILSDEDIELLQDLWIEKGKREAKAAKRASRPQRSAPSPAAQATPDRTIAAKSKKTSADGTGRSPKTR